MPSFRTLVLLAASLSASGATMCGAAAELCPRGEFETDLTELKHSFVQPDTRMEKTSLPFFGAVPPEISRIRSGVISSMAGGPLGHFAVWEAYDAARHLFVLVNGGSEYGSSPTDCDGYRFELRAGDRTYCMTIVSGTPDQARQFACLVNRLSADSAREAAEAELRRKEETAKLAAEAGAEAKKRGATSEVLVRGARISRAGPVEVLCPCSFTDLLKDGTEIGSPIRGEGILAIWLDTMLGASDSRLWRVLHPPHIIDIAVDRQNSLYLLVDPAGHNYEPTVIKLTSNGPSTAIVLREGTNGSEDLYASHIAVDDDGGLMLSASSRPLVFRVSHVDEARPAVKELSIKPSIPFSAPAGVEHASFEGMARDADGNLYLAFRSEILRRAPDGQLAPFAGSDTAGYADGIGSAAIFSSTLNIAAAPDGDLVVADTGNNVLRRVFKDGRVTTIAGRAGVQGSSDGRGANARFNGPRGITVDGRGLIYVADSGNHSLRRIAQDGTVKTLANLAGRATSLGTGLNGPSIVAVDSAGTVYLANGIDNRIQRLSPAGKVTTLDAQRFVLRID
jgi:sugar lactone lactonase YvrE